MATAVNEEIDALVDATEGRNNDSTGAQETVEIVATKSKGRKRKRNPETWKTKHVKKPGLRKNSPGIELSRDTEHCHKECLKQFSTAHLYGLREKFETLYYDEQNQRRVLVILGSQIQHHFHLERRLVVHQQKRVPILLCTTSMMKRV